MTIIEIIEAVRNNTNQDFDSNSDSNSNKMTIEQHIEQNIKREHETVTPIVLIKKQVDKINELSGENEKLKQYISNLESQLSKSNERLEKYDAISQRFIDEFTRLQNEGADDNIPIMTINDINNLYCHYGNPDSNQDSDSNS